MDSLGTIPEWNYRGTMAPRPPPASPPPPHSTPPSLASLAASVCVGSDPGPADTIEHSLRPPPLRIVMRGKEGVADVELARVERQSFPERPEAPPLLVVVIGHVDGPAAPRGLLCETDAGVHRRVRKFALSSPALVANLITGRIKQDIEVTKHRCLNEGSVPLEDYVSLDVEYMGTWWREMVHNLRTTFHVTPRNTLRLTPDASSFENAVRTAIDMLYDTTYCLLDDPVDPARVPPREVVARAIPPIQTSDQKEEDDDDDADDDDEGTANYFALGAIPLARR